MSIFVSIASYRDPQLVPTIEDCLAKARCPDELRFGICRQYGPEDPELPWRGDPSFQIIDVDWRESRGACWARTEIMKLWHGEEHFLQLDSHHRFAQDWDAKALHHAQQTGSAKPILTAYATPFTPGEPDQLDGEPLQMNFDRFTEDAIALFRPGVIPNWRTIGRSVRARFLSAHFLFAPGRFVEEVPYDPELYFIGEEITLAVRAYTHGYDLFHPPEIIVWHEYTRSYRTKHWDDHLKARGVEREWHERDAVSRAKVRRFLAEPTIERYGLGTERTFADYEAYAGLSFKHRRIQEYTRQEHEPPNPPAPPDWAERIRTYDIDIALDAKALPAAAREDPHFWFVGFHDAAGREVYRKDAGEAELADLLAGDPARVVVKRSFETDQEVTSWTVWPNSHSLGWLDKITRPIAAEPAAATLVTALLDLGRGQLAGPFARSFEQDDLPQLQRLLAAVELPMVVYVDPRHEELIWRVRARHNTRVVHLTRDALRSFPYYRRVQEIRARPDWLSQAGWLAASPQAAMADYNPMVMSKMRWLEQQAREDPFGTEHVFWIDAGLCRTVGDEPFRDPELGRRLAEAAGDFLFVGFPYVGSAEVHGFETAALAAVGGVATVDRVIRGGIFGGSRQGIREVAELYDRALGNTLADGHMGTEESVFTILSYRYPERFNCYMVGANGLIGPFFEALREGQLEDLRLREPPPLTPPPLTPPPATAAPARSWPPNGLLAEDPDAARVGFTTFLGLPMMQNRNAVPAFDAFFRHLAAQGIRVSRVIEIGVGSGGLSALLHVYCVGQGARFVTYDLNGALAESALFRKLGIELRVRDTRHEFVEAEIAADAQAEGVTVLLCDGGNKFGEVTTFADYLKPGDYIFAHDYAPDSETFERDLNGQLWSWLELTEGPLQSTIERNGLEPVLPGTLLAAAWGAWVKRGTAVKRTRPVGRRIDQLAVYVLGFNAPDQFEGWLDSVGRAAPELLASPCKVLLNNSTDETTFAAYDALCDRHGFTQVREGNLGINRGRVRCARHFEADTDCDAMVYFEDDMFLHAEDGLCANGFRHLVPGLIERACEIVGFEDLDFLKLSFTELYGDHTQNWAYYNLPDAERCEYFPNGPASHVEAIRSWRGLSYALGDVYYSNWPMVITRRGNRTLFLEGDDVPLFEQMLMVRALKLARTGALRAGVLLASPINHNRFHHYPAEARREC